MTENEGPYVWACGHDNGTWLFKDIANAFCWCGAEAIPYDEYLELNRSTTEKKDE